jgi:hypothetical protein
LIDEKKRKVGAGYLTDQGALFLVAADLGVSFDNVSKTQTGLKDIYIGAKEATVVGRIMNIYPIHRFTKRDSNEQAATRTLVIYDKDAKVKVKLWDKHTTIPDEMGLHAGDLIKVVLSPDFKRIRCAPTFLDLRVCLSQSSIYLTTGRTTSQQILRQERDQLL